MKIQAVIVDQKENPIGRCAFDEASFLLSSGKVRVHKLYPYTLMVKPDADWQAQLAQTPLAPALSDRLSVPRTMVHQKEVC